MEWHHTNIALLFLLFFFFVNHFTPRWIMCGLGSNGDHYSLSSKVTVVKLWPSVIGEVTYLLACLTVSYDHLSSYGSGFWLVGLRCFTLFPLYWLYMACVLCRCCPHKSHKSFSDYVEWLLGYFFSTNVLFVEKRCATHLDRCVAHAKLPRGDRDLPPPSTSCSYFIGCDGRQ